MSFSDMNLDSWQTRRLYLAGTVAFPTPFPCIGTISFESGTLWLSPDDQEHETQFVVVQEPNRPQQVTIRAVMAKHVSAIFFPRSPEKKSDCAFSFSEDYQVKDFENGEWFLKGEIDAGKIAARLGIKVDDIQTRESIARGLIFVPENRSVLTTSEFAQTAGSISFRSFWSPCECDCYW